MDKSRILIAILPLLAGCYSPIYSDADEAKDTCRDLGYTGETYRRCVARRTREAECRSFVNSSDYTAAEARRRGCE
ncbi:MAG: hypothetical protein KIT16_16090 [Rhodospirillaceae bacterium]|nr:hypothetical protein [Rhodospirillaceae bacterium]